MRFLLFIFPLFFLNAHAFSSEDGVTDCPDSPRECEKFGLARITHTLSSEGGQDDASALSSIVREHCQTDKARAIEGKDGVTDCPESPRECEKCGLGSKPEEILKNMTLEEKIGQLFIAGVYSNRKDALSEGQQEDPIEYIEKMIRDYSIGGVIFKMRWTAEDVRQKAESFQQLAEIPLFMALDAEWGLNMRMSGVPPLPKNQALGEIKNDQMIYEMGKEIGRQCRLIGINWNFSPVVDINSNPSNPIIHDRSFGSDKWAVARKGILMINGLQDEGVLATAKHFPGHGDTSTDSHTGLPILQHSKARLYQEELVPFIRAINAGVKSVMCAHLLVPAYDKDLPTSLSPKVVTGLLKETLQFEGLVVTDDLLMDAVSKKYSPGEAALLAFQAGNDVILSSRDIEVSIAAIKEAVEDGRVSEEELDFRVVKILAAKEWIERQRKKAGFINDEEELFNKDTYALKKRLYREVVHVRQDRKGALPIEKGRRLVIINIGGEKSPRIIEEVSRKTTVSQIDLSLKPTEDEIRDSLKELTEEDTVVVLLMGMSRVQKDNFGVPQKTVDLIDQIGKESKNAVLIIFGNSLIQSQFNEDMALINAFDEDPDSQSAAAELLFGVNRKDLRNEGPTQGKVK